MPQVLRRHPGCARRQRPHRRRELAYPHVRRRQPRHGQGRLRCRPDAFADAGSQAQVDLPRSWLRPSLRHRLAVRLRVRLRAAGRGRTGHGRRRGPRGRPRRQGHVVRPQVFQPLGLRLFRRGHRAHRAPEACRARFPRVLGQRLLRALPLPRGRRSHRQCLRAVLRRRQSRPGVPVLLYLQDYLPWRGRVCHGGEQGQPRRPQERVQAPHDRSRQAQPAAPSAA